jgi:hypothetical protein
MDTYIYVDERKCHFYPLVKLSDKNDGICYFIDSDDVYICINLGICLKRETIQKQCGGDISPENIWVACVGSHPENSYQMIYIYKYVFDADSALSYKQRLMMGVIQQLYLDNDYDYYNSLSDFNRENFDNKGNMTTNTKTSSKIDSIYPWDSGHITKYDDLFLSSLCMKKRERENKRKCFKKGVVSCKKKTNYLSSSLYKTKKMCSKKKIKTLKMREAYLESVTKKIDAYEGGHPDYMYITCCNSECERVFSRRSLRNGFVLYDDNGNVYNDMFKYDTITQCNICKKCFDTYANTCSIGASGLEMYIRNYYNFISGNFYEIINNLQYYDFCYYDLDSYLHYLQMLVGFTEMSYIRECLLEEVNIYWDTDDYDEFEEDFDW